MGYRRELHPPDGLPVGRDGLGDAVLKVGGDDQQPLLDEVEDGGGDEAAGVVAGGLPFWRGLSWASPSAACTA